jgi:hypothetical protein
MHPDDIEFASAGTLLRCRTLRFPFEPESHVGITKMAATKPQAPGLQKSQLAWTYTSQEVTLSENHRRLGVSRTLAIGCKYPEGFHVFQTGGCMPDFKLLP